MKILRVLFVLIGAAIVAFLFSKVGAAPLREIWDNAGWGYLLVFLYVPVWLLPNTAGWWFAFHRNEQARFRRLLWVRIAGEAVNYVTPSGYLGGEPLKAKMLTPELSASAAMSSVFIAKTTQTFALLLFILSGILYAAHRSLLGQDLKAFSIGVPVFLTFGVAMMVWAQLFGGLKWLGERLLRSESRHPWIAKGGKQLIAVDELLRTFYQGERARLLASGFWHLLGWVAGIGEVYLVMRLLGIQAEPWQAFLMFSIAMASTVGGFFIPGGLGAFEGGHALGGMIAGMDPQVGVSVSLVRRVREIVMIGLGFVILSIDKSWKTTP